MCVGRAMRRDRSVVPTKTSRRDVLLAAGSTLALRPAAMPRSNGESYLALLLRRRDELERLITGFADQVDRLRAESMLAIAPQAIARHAPGRDPAPAARSSGWNG